MGVSSRYGILLRISLPAVLLEVDDVVVLLVTLQALGLLGLGVLPQLLNHRLGVVAARGITQHVVGWWPLSFLVV